MSNQPLISIIIPSYNKVKYKVNLLKIVNTTAILFVAAMLFLDTYFYPGAVLNYFGFSSKIPLLVFVCLNIFFKIFKSDLIFKQVGQINKKIAFPALVGLSFVFILLNNVFYETFILNKLGIHTESFTVLSLLSGFLIYINRDISKYDLIKKAVYFGIPFLMLAFVFIHRFNWDLLYSIVREDGPVEVVQFILFAISGIIFAILAFKEKDWLKRITRLAISAFLIFIAIEEISWGQRVVGVDTPEQLMAINYQDEINIHNIKIFQRLTPILAILMSTWGVFGYKIYKFLKGYLKKAFIYPASYLVLCFLPIGAYYILAEYQPWYYDFFTSDKLGVVGPYGQETTELYLAIGFFLFAIDNLRHKRDN